MGYTTDFLGEVRINPPLNSAEIDYLKRFAHSRRMRVKQGPYFVDQPGQSGQEHGENVIDYNEPPRGQPSLWCQWVPAPDGTALRWDGHEKFYAADKWMRYLVDHFLKPGARAQARKNDHPFSQFTFDHVCDGTILAIGQQYPDLWRLEVTRNKVRTSRYFAEDYDVPYRLLTRGESLDDALYLLSREPEQAIAILDTFFGSLRRRLPMWDLARFLWDVAAAFPTPLRESLEKVLRRHPIVGPPEELDRMEAEYDGEMDWDRYGMPSEFR